MAELAGVPYDSDNDNDYFDRQYVDSDESDDEITEDEEDMIIDPPAWCNRTAGLKDIPFTGENKILWPFPEDATPLDYFNVMIDPIFLGNIVRETNRNALEIFCGNTTTPKSRITKYKDIDEKELKIFIGLLLHTGTIKMNRLADYWKITRLFNIPFFRENMSRDRFLIILRCLHFAKNRPEHPDRLFSVRLLIDHFNNKMQEIYSPTRELSLDEGMVLWRGRLIIRQYIKGKRH